MYIEDLLTTFENITKDSYPELTSQEILSNLQNKIEKKKYDLQDQTIIERILNEDIESFSESFLELLGSAIPDGEERIIFFKDEDSKTSVINLFIKSVEHSIDYFYNDIISKQFSGK